MCQGFISRQAAPSLRFCSQPRCPVWFARRSPRALPEITVTADRIDEPVNSTGSDVTVIPGARIQQWGANGITEVLQEAVGVTVSQNGGPSTLTSVSLRGGNPGRSS